MNSERQLRIFSRMRTPAPGAKSEEGRLHSQARLLSFFVALVKLEIIISPAQELYVCKLKPDVEQFPKLQQAFSWAFPN